jgi:hypothetical protein
VRIYAEFNDQDDRLVSCSATQRPGQHHLQLPLLPAPHGRQHRTGCEVIAKDPMVMGTFCTIGLAEHRGADQTNTSPGFPSLPVLNHTSMFWSCRGSAQAGAPMPAAASSFSS